MEMPDINLPHADLNKCNQTPNHLANHLKEILSSGVKLQYIYIYIYIL